MHLEPLPEGIYYQRACSALAELDWLRQQGKLTGLAGALKMQRAKGLAAWMETGSGTRLSITWRSNDTLPRHSSRRDSGMRANRRRFPCPHPTGRPGSMQYVPDPRGIQSLLRSRYLGEAENQSVLFHAPACSSWHTALPTADTHRYDLSHHKGTQQVPHRTMPRILDRHAVRGATFSDETTQVFITIADTVGLSPGKLLLVCTTWQQHF